MTTGNEIVLQKTHGLGFIALSEKDYASLPDQVVIDVKDKGITSPQFKALHVWCDKVAKVLNQYAEERGDNDLYRMVINPFTKLVVRVPWDKESVKQDLYKPTLKKYKGMLSTKDQSTAEPSVIAEALARGYMKYHNVPLPMWPNNRG